jgi:glycosyltransferase involved in cell wall biosynthesis
MKEQLNNLPKRHPKKQDLKLVILQRVCPTYRTALFKNLCTEPSCHVTLVIGEDVPNSKVRSTNNLNGINIRKLKTRFLKVGHRTLTWHIGLINELRMLKPDVILCEGESHFIGYLQAIFYKLLYRKETALIHWCFISLPGEPLIKPGLGTGLKRFFRKYFDAFLLYSSYSKERLIELGVKPEKAFIATNVGDVKKFITNSDSLHETPQEARRKLGLPERFTVLYTGTLDMNKRPDMMLDLSKTLDKEKFTFVLLGSGVMLEPLKKRVRDERLQNVFLPGRVEEDLFLYYRASNTLLIPGRGGIVISEAMSFGLPVIVHQADGTEYDLAKNNETGIHLQNGNLEDFKQALLRLQGNPELYQAMRKKSRQLVEACYTTDNMVKQIFEAAHYAKNARMEFLLAN